MSKGILDQLNLRPNERRLLVAVLLVTFVVVNLWFVVPHFKDWGELKIKMAEEKNKLIRYQNAIAKVPELQQQLNALSEDGVNSGVIGGEDQAVQLQTTIKTEARKAGLKMSVSPRGSTVTSSSSTNQFFTEKRVVTDIANAEPKQLVDFLYSLGTGESMIRVENMDLQRAPLKMQLRAKLFFVAKYQKSSDAESN